MTWLTEQFGLELLQSAQVVLPTAEFFPDAYSGAPEDVQVLSDKVCRYVRVDPAKVDLHFYHDRNPVYDGEMRHGTAGLYEPVDGRYRIWMKPQA
jgi:hypothetical protein